MARFSIRELEGMRQLRVDLAGESIRTVRGAMARLEGDIRVQVPLPGPGTLLRTMISSEAAVRPRYSGAGTVLLEPSMRGFHVFEARDRRWILSPGVFWAAEGEVRLGLRLERMIPSFWAGDGLLSYQTTVSGDGAVAIKTPGPVEEIEIDGELVVQGRGVLARTDGLRFSIGRPGGFLRGVLAGEPMARKFVGKGRALVCWTPFWNQYMHDMVASERSPVESF